jgi:alpha-D-xyloside xylohydrolase
MKIKYILIIVLFPFLCQAQAFREFHQISDGIQVKLSEGTLGIYPLAGNAIRIKFCKEENATVPELVFLGDSIVPVFQVNNGPLKVDLITKNIIVSLDKPSGKLSFADHNGNIFLTEREGTRKLSPGSVMNEPCYVAEQSFESPEDELLFGLGQFQDGYFNVRGITSRLIQTNSQIAIPFIYSSKGYGLLWHQYGLTDFNPADHPINLERQYQNATGDHIAEVTTTSGTQKILQNQSLYTGKFSVPRDGEYSVFLDLGDMGNRHFVTIDGKPCIDQTNFWLPPAAGTLVKLTAGEHQVQLICKSDNQPALSWKPKDNCTLFRSPHAKSIDYVVFYGPSADSAIAAYRNISGHAPMLPQWAYGFWQCRERYTSGSELVETVNEFRRRNLPVDVIVQDWQYWGNNGWGVPKFDTTHYADPAGFIGEIHKQHAHLAISIWSNPDKNSEIGKEYVAKGRYITDSKWLDYFNPETREDYWSTLNANLFVHGVDSWWMDATEPENDALKGLNTYIGPGEFYRLTYPLMVCKAVYDGQRKTTSDKRVCILTRSAFAGQQKYGSINWSGDIGGTWDAYRRQIVAGLNYSITGLPYWTTDIGGFFRPGPAQYSDTQYHELLIRWFQWGAFNPIFRIHGYQTETEPWKYGQQVEDNLRSMLNLRYRLLPYIYSEAWQVTSKGSTMMRPLVMDFRVDTAAINSQYEYMFGKSILVAPVTEPGVISRDVYLPKSSDWFDLWTGKHYHGGQTTSTAAPSDKIPLFVKAGSILPMGKLMQYAGEKSADTLEIRIYQGSDAHFDLYEDEGDNYNYEKGEYTVIPFEWNDKQHLLRIGDRKGSYDGYLIKRIFNIVFMSASTGREEGNQTPIQHVVYTGGQIEIKAK